MCWCQLEGPKAPQAADRSLGWLQDGKRKLYNAAHARELETGGGCRRVPDQGLARWGENAYTCRRPSGGLAREGRLILDAQRLTALRMDSPRAAIRN